MKSYKPIFSIHSIDLIVILVITLININSLGTTGDVSKEKYFISVKLNDLYNPIFKIRIPIEINKQFRIVAENGNIKTTIAGTIGNSYNGKYPITLTVSEWESEKSNISDTTQMNLELDKPVGYGPVSSFVYLRTVTLSKKQQENKIPQNSHYQE